MSDAVNVEKLRQRYADAGCLGVMELIDFLASPQGAGTHEIGSGTIGFDAFAAEMESAPDTDPVHAARHLGSLYIGSRDGSVTPLEWLEDMSVIIGFVKAEVRQRFDRICASFARIATAKPVGDVLICSGGKCYGVPAESYRDDMTEAELAPYRVERTWLDEGF